MTDLSTLIERLEAAPEGSPELDEAIRQYLGANCLQPEFYAEFTRSLDAAMTLLANGWWWQLQGPNEGIRKPNSVEYSARIEILNSRRKRYGEGFAATPALATCAAALRARGET